MTHAYNEIYLYDNQILLATLFDFLLNDIRLDHVSFMIVFANSSECKKIERGELFGKSGYEVGLDIMRKDNPDIEMIKTPIKEEKTKEYWAGYYLAYYQWYEGIPFKRIFEKIQIDEILNMYNLYHELDVSRFVEAMNDKYYARISETRLKKRRTMCELSQSELAKRAGLKTRTIQLYEQRLNDIDKASASTLYKLARSLHCNIEDLLENPQL